MIDEIVDINTTDETDSNTTITPKLSITTLYNKEPNPNEEILISIISDSDIGDVDWSVLSQPASSTIAFNSVDNKSATFTATEMGNYDINAYLTDKNITKISSFTLSPSFPVDISEIKDADPTADIDSVSGVVNNKAWVNSATLSEAQIKAIITNYGASISIEGYDPIDGVLLNYDESDTAALEILEELKFEKEIDSISPMVYVGKYADKDFFTPEDGSLFSDEGENWHLEKVHGINAVDAWDITRGSDKIIIGILDSGFYYNHEDIMGRFSTLLYSGFAEHGTGVAGTIGATSDNQIGMSGINHLSPIAAGLYYKPSYLSLMQQKNIYGDKAVKVINNSYGAMGNNSGSMKKGIYFTRTYRSIAQQNPHILHIWAAGNDGADANTQNGALHLSSEGAMNKIDNIMVVAAMGSDDSLHYYSDYGQTVDIAAPSEFLSLKNVTDTTSNYYSSDGTTEYGAAGSGGFNGTSAAAPVVTGVASLIYSINPNFSAAQVKDILIKSSTSNVIKRHTSVSSSETTPLAYPIPIVNAASAVQMAYDITNNKKVDASYTLPDPFTPTAEILFTSIDENATIIGTDWILHSSSDGGNTWTYFADGTESGDIATVALSESINNYKIVTTLTLKDTNNIQSSADKELLFNYSKITLTAKDTVSLKVLSGVTVSIDAINKTEISSTGSTDSNGQLFIYLTKDNYKVYGQLNDYEDGANKIYVNDFNAQHISLNMTPSSVGSVGSLNGIVTNLDGSVLEGVSVRISGGVQTNGFFASATTDTSGHYIISNIAKNDLDGNPITSFILEASKDNYLSSSRENIIVLKGKERTENFSLIDGSIEYTTLFFDDMESSNAEWIADGQWNRVDLSSNDIVNTLVDTGYTSLAPDEDALSAHLPLAFSGDFSWWYGSADTGTFIGTQLSGDLALSGGTSTDKNSADLISPEIDMSSATSPKLKFRTWWEIESFQPNADGFDRMIILISKDGGTTYTELEKLNPYLDPSDTDREHKPFSSGGFNRFPMWVLQEINLSEYTGETIQIKFNFSTMDARYNGFRGWIIDDIEVVDY